MVRCVRSADNVRSSSSHLRWSLSLSMRMVARSACFCSSFSSSERSERSIIVSCNKFPQRLKYTSEILSLLVKPLLTDDRFAFAPCLSCSVGVPVRLSCRCGIIKSLLEDLSTASFLAVEIREVLDFIMTRGTCGTRLLLVCVWVLRIVRSGRLR